MSDELLEYSARKQSTTLLDDAASEAPAKKGGLNRLSTIFLVVLGLHVVVIVGISAYHLLRGNPDTPVSHIETNPAPAMEAAKAPEATPAPAVASSMPSPDDKVWQTQAPAEVSTPVASAPAPVEAPTPAMAPAAERIHVVAKGDTLAKIAKKFGTKAETLAKLNSISDPKKLKIGMKIQVPGEASAKAEAPAAAPAAPAAAQDMAMLPKNSSN